MVTSEYSRGWWGRHHNNAFGTTSRWLCKERPDVTRVLWVLITLPFPQVPAPPSVTEVVALESPDFIPSFYCWTAPGFFCLTSLLIICSIFQSLFSSSTPHPYLHHVLDNCLSNHYVLSVHMIHSQYCIHDNLTFSILYLKIISTYPYILHISTLASASSGMY
jgi:hypothetical protein